MGDWTFPTLNLIHICVRKKCEVAKIQFKVQEYIHEHIAHSSMLFRLGTRGQWSKLRGVQFSAIGYNDGFAWLPVGPPHGLHRFHDVEALDDLAEHDVLPVEPRRGNGDNEELGAVGVGARVGHRQGPPSRVPPHEVLVRELLAVDGLAAGAIALREVAGLAHELGDDAVERAPFVVEVPAALADALFPCA